MDNLGELFLAGFLQGIGMMFAALWEATLANPWMFVLIGGLVVAGLYQQFAPRGRRRRAR